MYLIQSAAELCAVLLSKIENAFAVQLLICPNQGDNG